MTWISWPQLTAIHDRLPVSLPLNVVGQPSTGPDRSGNRTWIPLFARASPGASSRNSTTIEKSPYWRTGYQRVPNPPPAPARLRTVPSSRRSNPPSPAYSHASNDSGVPSRITS
ncbi:Uncharacterised protein [Mycobacteroides abscessus]|nr:Uncharacterised protein [Mycobacteroides abscessus]